MSSPSPLSIAGVPEAFNDAFDHADFTSHGVTPRPEFIPYPGGSGAMVRAVASGAVDAGFVLTDCLVSFIESSQPVRFASSLITSPLTWGIITKAGRPGGVPGLARAVWGVSRLGSGSHVMAQVLAARHGWPVPTFKPVGDFAALRRAVQDGDVDAFLWERFTTKPYVDAGEVQTVGDIPTPWGCFSVAVHADIDSTKLARVRAITSAFVQAGRRYVADGACAQEVAKRYGMTEEDARAWAATVLYADSGDSVVSEAELRRVRAALVSSGVIDESERGGGDDGGTEGAENAEEERVSWYTLRDGAR